MKKYIIWFCLAVMLGAAALTISCQKETPKQGGPAAAAEKELYICPMHPQITSDKPGDCPICSMRLVLKKTMQAKPTASPSGLAAITVSEAHRKHMGLTFGTVELRNITREVRTSARIVPDETRLYRITTKIEGYVEQLFVNVTGQEVKKGEPLLSIYSPELVATQQELLTALPFAEQLSHSAHESISSSGKQFVEGARRRLKFWDVSDEQIKRLEKTGRVEKFITLYAPATGYVFEKTVLPGQKIMPGESLLVVADLTTVWAEADIYESDLAYVKVGMPVTLTLSYWPGKSFEGEVSFLNPFLDPSDCVAGQVRGGDFLGLEELAPGMGPAPHQDDRWVAADHVVGSEGITL